MTQTIEGKAEALKAALQEGMDALTSGSDWESYLAFQARFPSYSFSNTMLVFSQRPSATLVMAEGGPKSKSKRVTWHSLGRTVKPGAQKIWIWAPAPRKYEDASGEQKVRTGFIAVPVYDIADTEGEPVPAPVAAPRLLEGEDEAGLLGSTVSFIESQGFTVQFVPSIPGSAANGDMNPTGKVVRICTEGRDTRQQAKTAVHEAAHLILHSEGKDISLPREQKEVEAESTAFVVSAYFGVDTGAYSFSYVAGWAASTGFTPRTAVKHSGGRINKAAVKIIRALSPAESLAASQELAA